MEWRLISAGNLRRMFSSHPQLIVKRLLDSWKRPCVVPYIFLGNVALWRSHLLHHVHEGWYPLWFREHLFDHWYKEFSALELLLGVWEQITIWLRSPSKHWCPVKKHIHSDSVIWWGIRVIKSMVDTSGYVWLHARDVTVLKAGGVADGHVYLFFHKFSQHKGTFSKMWAL